MEEDRAALREERDASKEEALEKRQAEVEAELRRVVAEQDEEQKKRDAYVDRLTDRLILRRLQLYPVEWATTDQLATWAEIKDVPEVEAALERLCDRGDVAVEHRAGPTERWHLTSEGRAWAIENLDRLTGADESRPREEVDLLVDANERAEKATRHAGELEQRVEELERRIASTRIAVEQEGPDAVFRARLTETGAVELEKVAPEGDLVERAERACTALRVLDSLAGLEVRDPEQALDSIRRVLDRFVRQEPDAPAGAAVPLRIVDEFLKGYVGCVEERVVGLEERAAELQALVDEHLPAVAQLLEQLDGEDPPWWVKATRALDQLRDFRDSPLAVPPTKARRRR